MREGRGRFRSPSCSIQIGEDSRRHGARRRKAFFTGRAAIPLAPTSALDWKFREMIAFRDATARTARARSDRAHQPGRTRARHRSDRLGIGAAHRR